MGGSAARLRTPRPRSRGVQPSAVRAMGAAALHQVRIYYDRASVVPTRCRTPSFMSAPPTQRGNTAFCLLRCRACIASGSTASPLSYRGHRSRRILSAYRAGSIDNTVTPPCDPAERRVSSPPRPPLRFAGAILQARSSSLHPEAARRPLAVRPRERLDEIDARSRRPVRRQPSAALRDGAGRGLGRRGNKSIDGATIVADVFRATSGARPARPAAPKPARASVTLVRGPTLKPLRPGKFWHMGSSAL